MEREIKFRAWDEKKKMIFMSSIIFLFGIATGIEIARLREPQKTLVISDPVLIYPNGEIMPIDEDNSKFSYRGALGIGSKGEIMKKLGLDGNPLKGEKK